MGRALRPAAALGALVALAYGCQCIDPSADFPACEADGGCPSGLACVDAVCRTPGCAGAACSDGGADAGAANGEACIDDGLCRSGHCWDGVCCESACTAPCLACGTGLCRPVDAGLEPFGCGSYRCGVDGGCETSCTSGGVECQSGALCSAGQCFGSRPNGSPCVANNDCAGRRCIDGYCCDRECSGACERCDTSGAEGQCANLSAGTPGAERDGGATCAPFACSGSAPSCPTSCSSSAECATNLYCDGGACIGLLLDGQSCSTGAQCASGSCVDARCCATACGASCDACNVAGAEGSCTVLPRSAAGSPTCGAYVCDGASTSCPTSCASDTGCASSFYCSGGLCTPKRSPGAACAASRECLSASCADGVCCATACGGACQTCATGACLTRAAGLQGSPSCSPYLCDGLSPSCPSSCDGGAQCSSDGGCQGGVCVGSKANGAPCDGGTQCTSTRCVDGFCCDADCAGACDACNLPGLFGSCTTLSAGSTGAPSCSPYACSGASTSCPPACASEAACAPGYFCGPDGGCTAKWGLGAPCATGNQCSSGFCATGVCCGAACAGACLACDGAGACSPRASGSSCTADAGSGSCSGATCVITRTSSATGDSRISTATTTASAGSAARLQVGATVYVTPSGTYKNRALIKIPLSSLFSGLSSAPAITSATLKLRARNDPTGTCWSIGSSPAFFAEELTGGFTENSESGECTASTAAGTSWSDQPAAVSGTPNRGHWSSGSPPSNGTWLSVDLTAMVRAAFTAGKTQLYLRLIASDAAGSAYDESDTRRKIGIYSRESGTGPYLELKFAAP